MSQLKDLVQIWKEQQYIIDLLNEDHSLNSTRQDLIEEFNKFLNDLPKWANYLSKNHNSSSNSLTNNINRLKGLLESNKHENKIEELIDYNKPLQWNDGNKLAESTRKLLATEQSSK